MKSPPVCRHCGSAVDLPHQSDLDCFRAVDREIKAAQAHLRALTKRKGRLLRARLQERRRRAVASRRARRPGP